MNLVTTPTKDYELLDSGNGLKLERFGSFVVSRPDPEALWENILSQDIWDNADLIFERSSSKGTWKIKHGVVTPWNISHGGFTFMLKPTSFKHVGIFPEQVQNWTWITEKIQTANRPIEVLNLFAYTGGATLAALSAGASVTHVDGSKTAVTWAKENAALSGLAEKPVRWILDDARAYLKREIKRGKRYDAISMDPPAFGHGPDDEPWKIEEHFLDLMELVREVLSDNPLFIVINGYTAGYSPLTFENNLITYMKHYGGVIEKGELAIEESVSGRLLPAGIFARWSR